MTMLSAKACCLLLIAVFMLVNLKADAQPDGWKMTDRFYGFRYEISGDNIGKDFVEYIVEQADILGCFGWVQKSPKQTLVGEARCHKSHGKVFEEKLKSRPDAPALKVDTLIYPDTKIRLHFSHFKVLDESRDTCFLEEPHKCADLSQPQQKKGPHDEF